MAQLPAAYVAEMADYYAARDRQQERASKHAAAAGAPRRTTGPTRGGSAQPDAQTQAAIDLIRRKAAHDAAQKKDTPR